jgi:hypothetical protein
VGNYERGLYLDDPVVDWFPGQDVPPPTVPPDFVESVMAQPHPGAKTRQRLVWLGGQPEWSRGLLRVRTEAGAMHEQVAPEQLAQNLQRCHPDGWEARRPPSLADFESQDWFEPFRALGLLLV